MSIEVLFSKLSPNPKLAPLTVGTYLERRENIHAKVASSSRKVWNFTRHMISPVPASP